SRLRAIAAATPASAAGTTELCARPWPQVVCCATAAPFARGNETGTTSLDRMSAGEAITAEGLEALKEELARLEGEGRRAMAQRISAAREHGDLKENAEYHAAKEDQAHLETRIARLAERLRNARVVETPADDGGRVHFGATVHVIDEESGRAQTFTLVGPTEADLKTGKLSADAPTAQAIMGAELGQTVDVETPRGTKKWRVERIGA